MESFETVYRQHFGAVLPVVENGALVGIISIGDVVRAVVDRQQFVIKSLENYIMS